MNNPMFSPLNELNNYRTPSMRGIPHGFSLAINQINKLNEIGSLHVLWSDEGEIQLENIIELNNILLVGPPSTGKSTFIHQLIFSILSTKHTAEIKFIFIDYKKWSSHHIGY